MKLEKLLTIFLFVFGISTQTYSADCTNKPEWSNSEVYGVAGMEVVYDGKLYTSQHWTEGHVPSENYGEGKPWSLIGICDAVIPNYESPTMTPSNGSAMSSGTATFSWTEVAGATGYQIMVGTVANGNDIFPGNSNASNGSDGILINSYMVGSLPVDGTLFYVTLTVWHPDGVIKENYTYTAFLQNSAPSISFIPAPGLLSENMAIGTIVGTFNVSDEDEGDQVTLEFISSNSDNSNFTLSGNNLITAISFDFEIKSSYSVSVKATDNHSAFTEFTQNISIANIDPEYNYPEVTGANEDMQVEGITKFKNVEDLAKDSTIINGGEIIAKKLIVDELEYSDPTNVNGSFTIPGALAVGGSVSVDGAMDVAGEVAFDGNVSTNKLSVDTLDMGNGLISFSRQNGPVLQTYEGKVGGIKFNYYGPTGTVDRTEVYSGNAYFYKHSEGATSIDGGKLTVDSIFASDHILLTSDKEKWSQQVITGAHLIDNPTTEINEGKLYIANAVQNPYGPTFDVQSTLIEGETITTGIINARYINLEGAQISGGDLTVNGKLDVAGNIVAGDVISLAENTEGDESNTPSFGLSSKFLHMGLVEGDETIGWGLHLNAFSFEGFWGHNPIYYHGGEHIFSSRKGVGTGADYELMKLDEDGNLSVTGNVSVNNGSLIADKVITSNISSELNITAGHGNWLNLNTMNGKKWMIHNPSGQDKLEIGRNDGTVDKFGYLAILENGNVGIGTTTPESKLHVNGVVQATSVKIGDWTIETPDYVFQPDYKLRSLDDVEKHIKEKSHLPEVPSAADMKRDGVDLAEMNMILLKKVEELTLYAIEQNNMIKAQNDEIVKMKEDLIQLIDKN